MTMKFEKDPKTEITFGEGLIFISQPEECDRLHSDDEVEVNG
jgi:hypothetical protein